MSNVFVVGRATTATTASCPFCFSTDTYVPPVIVVTECLAAGCRNEGETRLDAFPLFLDKRYTETNSGNILILRKVKCKVHGCTCIRIIYVLSTPYWVSNNDFGNKNEGNQALCTAYCVVTWNVHCYFCGQTRSHLAQKLPSKASYWRKNRGKDRCDGKTRKKT